MGASAGAYYLFNDDHSQSTDNAYVNGHIIEINSRIAGSVEKIEVDNTDRVNTGDILLTLDQSDNEIELAAAQADLAQVRRQIAALYSKHQQSNTLIQTEKIQLATALSDLQARQGLAEQSLITKEELRHAQDAVKLAKSRVDQAVANQAEITAQTTGSTVDTHPSVLVAKERVAQAELNLTRTAIYAPVAGMVAQRTVQPGQQIHVGEKLMSVIPLDQMWIDANFKETQLKGICPGQPAEITVDSYGHKVKYRGVVQDIMAGSGSAFSVLPSQHATGNWIKVVQRVPVRVRLNTSDLKQNPLRIGLSAEVIVDTSSCVKNVKNNPPEQAKTVESKIVTPADQKDDTLIRQE
jgi:membrane fusion protein (multidrug efflux system)